VIDLRSNIAEQLKAYTPYIRGNVLASLIAIKGTPGPAELAGKQPFSGTDGLALDKAFGHLGWGFGSQSTRIWLGILPNLPGLPTLGPSELRLVCEIVDPLAIVTLDEAARLAIIETFSAVNKNMKADLKPGAECRILGRQIVSVEGFEESLADEDAKQKAWAQLKRCLPPFVR